MENGMKFEEAMKRLQTIVSDIEENRLDIDVIGERVREARELVAFCRDKLYRTDIEIQKLLSDQKTD